MEGIMMRGPKKSAMAVRNAKGEIILETSYNKEPSKAAKIPFVRGIVNMVSSLVGGYKYLMRSADIAIADAEEEDRKAKEAKEAAKKAAEAPAETTEEAAEATESTAEATESTAEATEEVTDKACDGAEAPETAEINEAATETAEITEEKTEAATETEVNEKADKKEKKNEGGAATVIVMVLGVVLGLGLAFFLFRFLPSLLYDGLDYLIPADLTQKTFGYNLLRSAFEGVLKIIILVLYMFAVSRMKEIRRVFMYHGAEHKTIFCYEAGLPLTVENIRTQRRFHPRCGTSFIVLVLIVSIIIGCFIPATLPSWLRSIIGIALLPLTIGIGYELIKLAGRKNNLLTRIISAPGVWLQHITTVEPEDSMIECAIAAMNEVIPEDGESDKW